MTTLKEVTLTHNGARRSLVMVTLILLIFLFAPARQDSTAQPSSKTFSRSEPGRTGTPAQALEQTATGSQRISATPLVSKKASSVQPDSGISLFLPAVNYADGGSGSYSLAVADVNDDGNPDLLVVSGCPVTSFCGGIDGVVGVLLGNGDGTFKPAVTYDAGGWGTGSIAVGDLNGDGKPDLVVTNDYFSDTVGVLLGNGDGTFQHAVTYGSGGGYPGSVAIVDVNEDGKPDIVVANASSCYACTDGGLVGILLGNGDGTFLPAATYSSDGYNNFSAASLAVGDVNGDGNLDLAVTNTCGPTSDCSENGSVAVLLGNGNGTFQAAVTYSSGALQTTSVALSDVNGDGHPDLLVTNSGCSATCADGTIGVLIGNGNGTFQPVALYDSGGPVTFSVAVADLDGDGRPDLAVANACFSNSNCNSSAAGGAGVLLGNGDGTFQPALTYGTGGVWADHIAAADINGDGRPDLLVVNLGGTNGAVGVLLNTDEPPRTFTSTTLTSSLNPSIVGQAVTFTATVNSAASAPPNGETVTFKNGATILGTASLTAGIASLTTSSLAGGIYTVAASYPGDANFSPSTSPAIRQVVNSTTKSATATTVVSNLNPSIYGQKVAWTATVTTSGSVPPAGKVKFTWGIYTLGAATLNSSGVATLNKSNLNADSYPLTAIYMGDASHLGSTSPVLNQVVTETTSAASVTSSANPSAAGQAVTFTATITSPTDKPTGPVTFSAGKVVLGTAQLSGGKATFTTSTLTIGSTPVTATYSGDSNIAKSSASVTQTVQP